MNSLELRIPPPVIALVCAAAMYGLAVWLPAVGWAGPHLTGPARPVVTLLVAACGLACDLSAIWAFRRHRTTVNPLTPQRTSAVVQNGVYRFSRNPMYVGMALLLTAWAAWLGQPLCLLVLPVFVAYITRFQIQPEERALHTKFGADYAAYTARVRRWL